MMKLFLFFGLLAATQGYNYKEAIKASLMFYEAQRSGYVSNNRIPWTRDNFLQDGRDKGVNLVGGYFDAGDYVKFNFPMAFSLTLLSWGGIDYSGGYWRSGQMQYLRAAVKWGTDYLLRCHTKKYELYVQVGDGEADHSYWGRPQGQRVNRPSEKIDTNVRGADVAAETAAAFASASILFKTANKAYSANLLRHARELYEYAEKFQGKYSDKLWRAAKFYKSSHFKDELAWAGAWMHRATNQWSYIQKAQNYYNQFGNPIDWAFGWDYKLPGAAVLLARATKQQKYKDHLRKHCNNSKRYKTSSKGQIFWTHWGSNRYACNTGLICLQAASLGIDAWQNKPQAKRQADFILGAGGRSFMVGIGKNPPLRPHHRYASCPSNGRCVSQNDNSVSPALLKGAVVGGPSNINGKYEDRRNNYIDNEVALDYNAGCQTLFAAFA